MVNTAKKGILGSVTSYLSYMYDDSVVGPRGATRGVSIRKHPLTYAGCITKKEFTSQDDHMPQHTKSKLVCTNRVSSPLSRLKKGWPNSVQ